MAFIAYVGSPNIPHLPGGVVPKTSTAFTKDTLVDLAFGSAYAQPSTSSSTTHTIFGLMVDKTVTTASSSPVNLDVVPLGYGPQHLYIADCTNNTASNQLYARQALTDAGTVANSSTDTSTNTGVFVPIAIVGAATDKKLLGYFVGPLGVN